ncbi:MAG: GntR family transcriptional regulator YhfZ [Acholeplasma sp.]|nr:GntR family transcriptional regulator YhfZ [Acholeplasma sp.]
MKNNLLKKSGIIVYQIACKLYFMSVGDRMPLVTEFEKELDVSRGTVQNALSFLRGKKYIELIPRGQLGTFIAAIDYNRLQTEIIKFNIVGVMPFPYLNKKYLGIATAIYQAFEDKMSKVTLLYNRGSSNRFKLLEKESVTFVISSKLSAKAAIKQNRNIKIIKDFGEGTYTTHHVVLAKSKEHLSKPCIRVGIDNESYDQKELTLRYIQDKNVKLINISAQKFLSALKNDDIDCAIWDYDSIANVASDYYYEKVSYKDIEVSNAVITVNSSDSFIEKLINNYLDVNAVKKTIQLVLEDKITPVY